MRTKIRLNRWILTLLVVLSMGLAAMPAMQERNLMV